MQMCASTVLFYLITGSVSKKAKKSSLLHTFLFSLMKRKKKAEGFLYIMWKNLSRLRPHKLVLASPKLKVILDNAQIHFAVKASACFGRYLIAAQAELKFLLIQGSWRQ